MRAIQFSSNNKRRQQPLLENVFKVLKDFIGKKKLKLGNFRFPGWRFHSKFLKYEVITERTIMTQSIHSIGIGMQIFLEYIIVPFLFHSSMVLYRSYIRESILPRFTRIQISVCEWCNLVAVRKVLPLHCHKKSKWVCLEVEAHIAHSFG